MSLKIFNKHSGKTSTDYLNLIENLQAVWGIWIDETIVLLILNKLPDTYVLIIV